MNRARVSRACHANLRNLSWCRAVGANSRIFTSNDDRSRGTFGQRTISTRLNLLFREKQSEYARLIKNCFSTESLWQCRVTGRILLVWIITDAPLTPEVFPKGLDAFLRFETETNPRKILTS